MGRPPANEARGYGARSRCRSGAFLRPVERLIPAAGEVDHEALAVDAPGIVSCAPSSQQSCHRKR